MIEVILVLGVIGASGWWYLSRQRERRRDDERMAKKLKQYEAILKEHKKCKRVIKSYKRRLEEKQQELRDQQTALVNVLEDITEEKKLGERRSEAVLENTGEAIVITDENGKVTYVNPAFERFTGFSMAELEGEVFASKIKMFDLKDMEIDEVLRSDSAAISGKDIDEKVKVQIASGELLAIHMSASPIVVDDVYLGVVRVIHDMSEELKIQQQKDDFFSIASHELRTPLTVIAGNIDLLLSGFGKSRLSDEDRELLEDMDEASQRLIKMVNSFLNVSRLDQGRLEVRRERFELAKLIQEVVEEMSTMADGKGIYLKYKSKLAKVWVEGDLDKVREVLINLIGNSLKFTKEGGIKVELKADYKRRQSLVTVADTGLGIAKDKQGLLFQRFQQAMNRTLAREAGGTGLGLYISREFARKMGGDLYLVSSREGKGAVFGFTLPLAKSE